VTDPGQSGDDLQVLEGASPRLPCGADADELLEQAADGLAGELTDHQRSCPQCQAALSEFSRIWEPVRSLAAEQVSLPAAVRRAMTTQIRRLTADAWYTLERAEGGVIRIAARVVARIARDAGREIAGVRVVFGRSTGARAAGRAESATLHHHTGAAVGVLGSTAVIDLAVAAEYGQKLEAIASAVQDRAIAEVRSKAGLQDVIVNVTVDDVS
jgi:uncharacterized alkaline shock family protein YloU